MDSVHLAIADGQKLVRKGLCLLIESFGGYEIDIEADNGKELIASLETAVRLPDICIVDVALPVKNGFDTALEINTRWPQIDIVAISSFDNRIAAVRMLTGGATAYILKEHGPEVLKHALSDVRNYGYYHTEVVPIAVFNSIIRHPAKRSLDIKDKELDFLTLSCTELTYVEIAREMGISARSIESYRERLCQKLSVKNRIGLAMFALRFGLAQIH